MKKNHGYILLLVLALGLVWYLADTSERHRAPFQAVFAFSFETKPAGQIEAFAKRMIGEYRVSNQRESQIRTLVNALECYHYLVYNGTVGVSRFYDFMRIVLLPRQREKLRDKDEYVTEIKRYLRRKRNLKTRYLKYEVSAPVPRHTKDGERIDVTVLRTDNRNRELITYSFRKFRNRYYLVLERDASGLDLPFGGP